MNHGALEAKLLDAALKLVGGDFWKGRRQGREAGETFGVLLDLRGQPVVHRACRLGRRVRRQLLRRGSAEREDLDVDAGLVHLLDPQIVEVVQPGVNVAGTSRLGALKGLRELGIPVVFLDRDDRDIRLRNHVSFTRNDVW
jgi:hypothetical protein